MRVRVRRRVRPGVSVRVCGSEKRRVSEGEC